MITIKLRNGMNIPIIGYGTWKIEDSLLATNCVKEAIDAGYTHIDTAMIYGNEEAVGRGIKKRKVAREDLFVTTKLWNANRGYQETMDAFNASLKRLGLEYVDLYLIHWPVPYQYRDNYKVLNIESYKAMETLYNEGKIKAIGVSNFLKHHIEELQEATYIPIMVNQIEFHPYYQDYETINYCRENEIVLEAYSPLGRGEVLQDQTLVELANKYNKSTAQICIKYAIQNNIIPLPKSSTKTRIKENIEVFDFTLTAHEMEIIRNLHRIDGRIGSHPDEAEF